MASMPKPKPSNREAFIEAAKSLDTDESLERFNEVLGKVARHKPAEPKVCPECHHVFQGNGWDGIDAHWKAKHENVMPYAEAWPLIKAGTYKSKK